MNLIVYNKNLGEVIPGLDEGISTMSVGGSAQMELLPHLAYGSDGVPGRIPANATLIYDVQLLRVRLHESDAR
jgi:FKBP-type peptidyl-prolyl cis-trans isomerase